MLATSDTFISALDAVLLFALAAELLAWLIPALLAVIVVFWLAGLGPSVAEVLSSDACEP